MNGTPPAIPESLFHGLIEAAPDALMVHARDGRILVVNAQLEVLFGYRRADLIGQSVEVLIPERFHASHVRHRAAYERAPEARPMGVGLDLWGVRADGREFPVEISLSPIETEDGLLVISTIRDVSERKQAEEERAHLLAREQAARAEAEAALRLRDQVLTVVTHDLGQPLATIRTAAQLSLQELAQTQALTLAALREYLTLINAATVKMTAMTTELVDLAQLQAGQPLELDYRRTDLVALARGEAAAHQETTAHHTVTVATTVPALVGDWDAMRLGRVVSNLLANAIKYSPAGGTVLLTIKGETDRGRAWGVLAVEDHGIGIPAADVPHLFERFYRASNVVGQIGGSGIGLAGAKGIVEQHGGTITAASREGQGTTITIRLPLA